MRYYGYQSMIVLGYKKYGFGLSI